MEFLRQKELLLVFYQTKMAKFYHQKVVWYQVIIQKDIKKLSLLDLVKKYILLPSILTKMNIIKWLHNYTKHRKGVWNKIDKEMEYFIAKGLVCLNTGQSFFCAYLFNRECFLNVM